jgi:hypothetical protein
VPSVSTTVVKRSAGYHDDEMENEARAKIQRMSLGENGNEGVEGNTGGLDVV